MTIPSSPSTWTRRTNNDKYRHLGSRRYRLRGDFSNFGNDVNNLDTGDAVIDGGVVNIVGKKFCSFIDQKSIPHYYCDSVNGLDSNDGLTEFTPKKTVSSIKSLAISSCVLEFARGSYFREELSGIPSNSVVKPYGTGNKPIFDCADVTTIFVKTNGFANLYQKNFTNQLTTSAKTKISMWFDGIRMIRATSQANCEATQGSFYVAISYTGSDTIYFHSPTSADPNTDGKVYELSIRKYGVQMSTGSECYSVATRRNGHNDGSLIGTKYISDCYGYDGTIHNIWNGGIAEDCIAEFGEGGGSGSTTLFVSYEAIPSANATYRYTRCKAISKPIPSNGWLSTGVSGFLNHTSGISCFENILYEYCESENCTANGFSQQNCNNAVFYECITKNCATGFYSSSVKTFMYKCLGLEYLEGSTRVNFDRFIYNDSATTLETTLKGCNIVSRRSSGGICWVKSKMQNYESNTCYCGSSEQNCTFVYIDSANGCTSLSFNKNIAYNTRNFFADIRTVPALVSDNNNVLTDSYGRVSYNGTTYSTFTAYKTALSKDENSIIGDPLFIGDVRAGDLSLNANSPANAIQAGATFFEMGEEDYRKINVLNPV